MGQGNALLASPVSLETALGKNVGSRVYEKQCADLQTTEGCDTMSLTSLKGCFMPSSTAMVHVRVDEQVKVQATETLAAMGLSVSDAVRVFLMRVIADKQIPFTISVPNVETRAAIAEADEISRKHRGRFATGDELIDDLEKNCSK